MFSIVGIIVGGLLASGSIRIVFTEELSLSIIPILLIAAFGLFLTIIGALGLKNIFFYSDARQSRRPHDHETLK